MSSRAYPIWNDVPACIYRSKKSYGARDTSECNVYVGTSAAYSEPFVHHVVTRREDGEYTVFRFGVDLHDGHGYRVLKTQYMKTKTREFMPAGFQPN